MSVASAQNPVPAPVIVAPTGRWDGDDGSWSTFALEAGTPPQSFRVLPATVAEEIWLPALVGCEGILSGISTCGDLRGINSFQGAPSRGYLYNTSNTWSQIGTGIFDLSNNLFGDGDVGLYGTDDVALGVLPGAGYGPIISDQIIAGIATEDFWLGSIGLGTSPGAFAGQSGSTPSLLVAMKHQNLTTSLSYGYTAGQSYASPPLEGSLVLGGYDQARLSSNTVSVTIDNNLTNQALQLGVLSIVASNTLSGSSQNLLPNSITANVDSAVSQLWLPADTCDSFAQAFGLTYDSETDLYLVNGTIHSQLRANNPSVTLTVGTSTGASTNIVMDYNAFDLEAGIPLYNTSTPYFPIRRAANESQYTLGRTFLQEAYIIVDWERSNFTVGQSIAQNATTSIVPMLPPTQAASPSSTPHVPQTATPPPKGLPTGAKAGIAVALIAIIAVSAGLALFFMRRRRSRNVVEDHGFIESARPPSTLPGHGVVEYFPSQDKKDGLIPQVEISEVPIAELQDDGKPVELVDTEIYELPDHVRDRELMSTPIMELQGSRVGSELDVSKIREEKDPVVGEIEKRDKDNDAVDDADADADAAAAPPADDSSEEKTDKIGCNDNEEL